MTNSGGLMLVCRWASVNVLVQNTFYNSSTKPAFTCSKSPVETDECVKSGESSYKDIRTMSLRSFWCPYS